MIKNVERVYEDETFEGYIEKKEFGEGFEEYPAIKFMRYVTHMVRNKRTGEVIPVEGKLCRREGAVRLIRKRVEEIKKVANKAGDK